MMCFLLPIGKAQKYSVLMRTFKVSYSATKNQMRQNRAVFEIHSDKRMDQMLREGNKEKLKDLQACGESCKTCSNRQVRQLTMFCKLKKKTIQLYNICEKHIKAQAVPIPA